MWFSASWTASSSAKISGYSSFEKSLRAPRSSESNSMQAVIISCGAPESFEVYEAPSNHVHNTLRYFKVCFESLTKIGFTLHGIANKVSAHS